MHGKIIFLQGNHDHFSQTQYRSLGWTVLQEARIRLNGRYFILSHYPYWPTAEELPSCEPHYLRYPERRPVDKGSFLLCGHVHQRWQTNRKMINVGVDVWNYTPVSLGMIDKLIGKIKPR